MKLLNRLFFLALFFSLFFSSCKSDDDGSTTIDPTAENKLALGVSAEALLSDDIYDKLVVELVYTTSFHPEAESIVSLRDFLNARVNKPGGIQLIEREIPDQAGAPFTLDKIREIEEEHRTQYTQGNTIAVYMFFSNGSSTNDTQNSVTLGTAYRNTSMVVYQRTLESITQTEPELLPILEQTTIQHEFGHILGLVNIQGDDIHNQGHEDPDSGKHCIVESCLMYFDATNVGRSMIERLKTRGAVPQLDPLCIADLQAKGGL